MSESVIGKESFNFSKEILLFFKEYSLANETERVIFKQLIRSATSIGANVEESLGSQSSKEFIFKLSIAFKECRETIYWIKLAKESNSFRGFEYEKFLIKVKWMTGVIAKIRKNTK